MTLLEILSLPLEESQRPVGCINIGSCAAVLAGFARGRGAAATG
jgi:hypothetical protein